MILLASTVSNYCCYSIEDDGRRSKRKRKEPKSHSLLEKIRKHRESGERIDYEEQKVEEIFEYVDEKEYANIIRKRQQDDWIEDDGTV